MGVFNLFRSKKKEEVKATSKFIDDEWLEVSASSKDEAIERACVALNTNPTHLEIKFLSKDGKKIRARKSTGESEVTDEKPARQPRQGQGQGRGRGRGGNREEGSRDGQQAQGRGRGRGTRSESSDRNDSRGDSRNESRGGRNFQGPGRGRGNHAQPRREDEQTDEMMMRGDEEENFNTEENNSRYNDFNDGYQDRQESRSRRHEEPEEDFVEEVEEETDLGRKAKEILEQIVQKIEANAKVDLFETNKTIRLEIVSSESGLFIGKFGQTLDSIQHLLKKILEIKFQDGKNLIVDAEEYRVRREESIETKARKLAKKARQEGRPVSVEPMNAMDRRIVHMALKGEPGIETKSVGEGSSRRVLIVPKRRNGGGRGGRDEGRGRGGRGGRNFQGRGRGNGDRQPRSDGNSRMHDSYDVPSLPKNEVFGDNPEEYFENANFDDEK
ncbi:MAG: KH domain-containing protein [Proteobacteria bacterium]|jgi:spoIIIJ-associated protein|nr:KH domain-containing protein [Pseudomonadota bacterium]